MGCEEIEVLLSNTSRHVPLCDNVIVNTIGSMTHKHMVAYLPHVVLDIAALDQFCYGRRYDSRAMVAYLLHVAAYICPYATPYI